MVTHEAVELFRKNNDHTKAISYTNAFLGSHLPTLITKLITSELGNQGKTMTIQRPYLILKKNFLYEKLSMIKPSSNLLLASFYLSIINHVHYVFQIIALCLSFFTK